MMSEHNKKTNADRIRAMSDEEPYCNCGAKMDGGDDNG